MTEKNISMKIYEALKKGTLIKQAIRKVCEPHNFKNRTAFELEVEYRIYKKMAKKYKDIIENANYKVSHEKSNLIWTCWLQGEENAPDIVKICINSLRNLQPKYKVIVIDKKNFQKYIKLPGYIMDKYYSGKIKAAHFTDLIRTELLCNYGGVWIDSTVLFTGEVMPDYIINSDFFVFKKMELNHYNDSPIVCSNWLISATKQNPILLLTRELMYKYWEDYNFAINYYIWHIMFSISTKVYQQEWNKVALIPNTLPHILQYEINDIFNDNRWRFLLEMTSIHKLNWHEQFNKNVNTFYMHILNNKDNFKGGV